MFGLSICIISRGANSTQVVTAVEAGETHDALSDNMSVIVWQMKPEVLINPSDPYLKPNRCNTWTCKFLGKRRHKFKSEDLQFNNRADSCKWERPFWFNVKDRSGIPSVFYTHQSAVKCTVCVVSL